MPAIVYDKERVILDYIMQFTDRYGYAPTLKEIGVACGMNSPATVHEHVEKLRQKGFIKKLDGASRGLEVVRTHYQMILMQLLHSYR
jgi:SOS-response transcriptional repressor LexA